MKLLLILLPFLFLLTSCFEEERIYTLNPDGSGKVEFKATFPLGSTINLNEGASPSPEQKAKKAVTKTLEDSEGVAAWANVSYKINDEGKIEFKGTAYFKDINKVKLKMGSIDSNALNPSLTKEKGMITIKCLLEDKDKKTAKPNKNKPQWAKMTKKQQKMAMATTRQGLMQMKGMLAGIAGDMSTKVTIHLPASAKKSTGFKQLSPSSYTITQTGEMMIKGIDQLLANEKTMRMLASDDINMMQDPPTEVLHQMLGLSGDPLVDFSASAPPSFDYKKEVQAAQKAAPAMMKKLGLTVTPAAPMAGKAAFKSLRLAGLQVVTSTTDRKVRPFNRSSGTTLSFIGELPGAVISADDGEIHTFVLDNDQNLLSSKSWDQKPRSIDLSDDGTLLSFEIQSDQLLEANATAIKTLKGEIICMAASSSKTTDLEFKKIKKGEKSEHFGAKITEIKKSPYNEGKKQISIHFDLKKDTIKKVTFFDRDGTELKISQNGSSWSGDSGRFTFLCDDTLSEDAIIAVEVFTDIKRHILPFLIENTPLIPRKSNTGK